MPRGSPSRLATSRAVSVACCSSLLYSAVRCAGRCAWSRPSSRPNKRQVLTSCVNLEVCAESSYPEAIGANMLAQSFDRCREQRVRGADAERDQDRILASDLALVCAERSIPSRVHLAKLWVSKRGILELSTGCMQSCSREGEVGVDGKDRNRKVQRREVQLVGTEQ